MKVVTHNDFLQVYISEPAAAPGRIESVLEAIRDEVVFKEAYPAGEDDIRAAHSQSHLRDIERMGLYNISALAAGGAIQAAEIGMKEPCFALIRPPGHHASADHCWGFCYFNNMAIALEHLRREKLIQKAHILDFDMHYGDGTVNILSDKGYVSIHNPASQDRTEYLKEVADRLAAVEVDVIAVSAGFDSHIEDWGRMLYTEDYQEMGRMVHETAARLGAGAFALLEGGYNHKVLGQNVRAFIRGLQGL